MRRSVATFAAVLLALGSAVGSAPSAVRAVTADDQLYIDGLLDDPLSQGIQELYESPAATISVVSTSPDHSTAAFELSVDDWALTFRAPVGEALQPGDVYGGLVVERTGHACEPWGGSFNLLDVVWGDDGQPTTFAADFTYACYPHEGLAGSIRYQSSVPIVAASSALAVDLGETMLGTPGSIATVSIDNIGHAPLSLGSAWFDGSVPNVDIVSDGCDDAPILPGGSCDVAVRLSGAVAGLGDHWQLQIPDNTARGYRWIRLDGDVWATTTTTLSFDTEATYWPGNTIVHATVDPVPVTGGTVTFTTSDGGDPVELHGSVDIHGLAVVATPVSQGDHEWTASFGGSTAWLPSTSAAVTHRTGIQTSTSLVALINPLTVGDVAHLRATVAAASGNPVPSGTLTVRDEADVVIGSGPVGGSDDSLDLEVAGLSLGQHDFTASYASSSDGQPTSGSRRVLVATQGIAEDWTAIIPMSTGDLWLQNVAADASGIYVAGVTGGAIQGHTNAGGSDIVVARFDAAGTLIWADQFGSGESDVVGGITVTPSGIFVSGKSDGDLGSGGPLGTYRGFLARYSATGSLDWIRHDASQGDTWQVAPAVDGGVYTAGRLEVGPNTVLVRRYSPAGTVRWQKTITACCLNGSPGSVELRTLASDPGGLLVGGWSLGSTLAGGNHDDERGFVHRFSPDGVPIWTREVDAPYGAADTHDVAASQKGIVAMGTSQSPIAGQPNAFPDENIWARRYSFTGETVWTKPFARERLVPRCGTFVTLARTVGLPSGTIGSTLAGLALDATEQWRFEKPAPDSGWFLFEDVAVVGNRAYVLEEGDRGDGAGVRLLAIKGLPAASDCDTVAPSTSVPRARFLTGSQLGASAAIKVWWSGSDAGSGVARFELLRALSGGPWTVVDDGLTSPSRVVGVSQGWTYQFAARTVDRADNVRSATGRTFQLRRIDDRSASIEYVGGWKSSRPTSASNGTLRYSRREGASATFRFTGSAVAWVAPVGPTRGSAKVYVDGKYVGKVRLWRSTSAVRQVVWEHNWAGSGRHRVTIKVIGTAGHPRVDVDAFLYLH